MRIKYNAPQLDISAGATGPVTLFAADSSPARSLGSWSAFMDSALGHTLNPPFTPYDNNLDFLIGAYILEDVMVTAYEVRSMAGLGLDTGHQRVRPRCMTM